MSIEITIFESIFIENKGYIHVRNNANYFLMPNVKSTTSTYTEQDKNVNICNAGMNFFIQY